MAEERDRIWKQRIENDAKYRRDLSTLCKELRAEAISGIEYFQDLKGVNNEKFYVNYVNLYEHLDSGIEPGLDEITRILYLYDFDPSLPANGYRSMVQVVHKCCLKILQLVRHISVNRDSFLFRGAHYSKELDAYVSTLGQLRACLYYLERLASFSQNGELFPDEGSLSPEEYETAEGLMGEVEALSQETFYGRCLGFQFCSSMVKPLTTINLVLASFGDGYDQESSVMKIASSVLGGGKYFLDPDSRAQQVVNVTRNGDISFCKAFWSLAENQLMHNLPLIVCPPVAIDKVIVLEPEPFDLPLADDSDIARINPPCAHSGPGPVYTRLLCSELRQGQEAWLSSSKRKSLNRDQLLPPSPNLVIQIHGGGFVAQSSASHQVYLRHWAKELHVPFLCIDYSLAPEDPFPRQLEEVFFAYCWALNNSDLLGWTGERFCMVGDSAGANLCIANSLRAISAGIRLPDGIVSIYGSMLVKYQPSPSRILALMDPLLPMGILGKCLAAYAGIDLSSEVPMMTPTGSPDTDQGSAVDGSPVRTIHKRAALSEETDTKPAEIHHSEEEEAALKAALSDAMRENEKVHAEEMIAENRKRDDDSGDVPPENSNNEDSETQVNYSKKDEVKVNTSDNDAIDQPENIEQNTEELKPQDTKPETEQNDNKESTQPITHQPQPPSKYKTESDNQTELDSDKKRDPDSARLERMLSGDSAISPSISSLEATSPKSDISQKTLLAEEFIRTHKHTKSTDSGYIESKDNNAIDSDRNSNNSEEKSLDESRTLFCGAMGIIPNPRPPSNIPISMDLRPKESSRPNFTLDLGFLRRRTNPVTKSPSNPDLTTLQHKLHIKDRIKVQSPISPSSPFLGLDGVLKAGTPTYAKIRHFAQSPVQAFRHLPVSRNPYMSPFLAPPDLLQYLPPIYFVTSHLDPILDDSIEFAKKLRDIGKEVHLDIVEDLPHGFLNFVLTSMEAKQASDICVHRLRDILGLNTLSDDEWEVLGDELNGLTDQELDDLLDLGSDDLENDDEDEGQGQSDETDDIFVHDFSL